MIKVITSILLLSMYQNLAILVCGVKFCKYAESWDKTKFDRFGGL